MEEEVKSIKGLVITFLDPPNSERACWHSPAAPVWTQMKLASPWLYFECKPQALCNSLSWHPGLHYQCINSPTSKGTRPPSSLQPDSLFHHCIFVSRVCMQRATLRLATACSCFCYFLPPGRLVHPAPVMFIFKPMQLFSDAWTFPSPWFFSH